MGVFEFMIKRKKPTPGELAKERLKVVLVHDRLKLNPDLLELIRAELLSDKLLANIPIKRQKVKFEWDPPSHTSSNDVLRGKVSIEETEAEA